jgi:hypothetical protein
LDCTFPFGEVLQHWPLLLEGAVNTLRLSLVGMSHGMKIKRRGRKLAPLAISARRRDRRLVREQLEGAGVGL